MHAEQRMTRTEGLESCKKEPVSCKNGATADKDERGTSKERLIHAEEAPCDVQELAGQARR